MNFDMIKPYEYEVIYHIGTRKIYSHGYIFADSYASALRKVSLHYLSTTIYVKEIDTPLEVLFDKPIEVQVDELP